MIQNTAETEYGTKAENGKIMYFGSVKFFKHLIYTVVIGWFVIATGLAVFFGVKYSLEHKENEALIASANVSSEEKPSDGEEAEHEKSSLEQHYLRMSAQGYTPEDILDFLEENESEAVSGFVDGYISANPDKIEALLPKDAAETEAGTNANEYTGLYPELYVTPPTEYTIKEKTIYLTFDDGPSENTVDILNILDKYGIKATFFMSGGDDERTAELIRMVAEKGHKIGIHSKSHEYNEVYSSVEAFLEDMSNTYNCIYSASGVEPDIIRFPGGSINNYNRLIYNQLIAEVTRRGFVYYDWNVSGQDASNNATWTSIYRNILNGIESNDTQRAIILLHDGEGRETTVTTVEDIIIALIDKGYTFEALDNTVRPINFSYTE